MDAMNRLIFRPPNGMLMSPKERLRDISAKEFPVALRIITWVHVAISFVAIATGLVVAFGMLTGQRMDGCTQWFLITTVSTSVTGFFFPFQKYLPSHVLGIISLVVLLIAILARYSFQMDGAWRWIYVAGAVIALYLNVLVLIVQSFQKVPALKAKAPTQKEPPFVITQLVTLVAFIAIGIAAGARFYPAQ